MQSHLIINNVDYTDYIVSDSYNINASDIYESWQDGNMVEHRIIVTTKVKGSFKLACSEEGLTVSDFLTALNGVTVNGVATIGLFVTNKSAFEAIECYYEVVSAQHIKSTGDKFYDVLEVKITER